MIFKRAGATIERGFLGYLIIILSIVTNNLHCTLYSLRNGDCCTSSKYQILCRPVLPPIATLKCVDIKSQNSPASMLKKSSLDLRNPFRKMDILQKLLQYCLKELETKLGISDLTVTILKANSVYYYKVKC